jgi:hypothetical protein
MYRRQTDKKHQLVVPKSLVNDIIKVNHDPVYVAHPGVKRTYDLISLNYWWPKMRNSISDWVAHVIRMEATSTVKKLTEWEPGTVRPVGRTRLRWLDQVEEDLMRMKVRNWREREV